MKIVYLGLGSNLGDRMAYLRNALRLLQEAGVVIQQESAVYETSPVGGVAQDRFLNMVVKAATDLEPQVLLEVIHRIEQQLERIREVHWGPRTLDIDILYFAEQTIATETLVIPHPELFKRLFVLVPLLDVCGTDFYQLAEIKEQAAALAQSEQSIEIYRGEKNDE